VAAICICNCADCPSPCCIAHIDIDLGLTPLSPPSDYNTSSSFGWDVSTVPDVIRSTETVDGVTAIVCSQRYLAPTTTICGTEQVAHWFNALTRDITATGDYTTGSSGGFRFTGQERWKHNWIWQNFSVLVSRSSTNKTRIQVQYDLWNEYLRYPKPGSSAEAFDPFCDTGAITNFATDYSTNFCGGFPWIRSDCVAPTINSSAFFPTVLLWGKYGGFNLLDSGWRTGTCAEVLSPFSAVTTYTEYNSNPSFSLPFRSCMIPISAVNTNDTPCGGSRILQWRTWATWNATNRVTFALC
jgi:hypothetical protein